jgi:hypothetical protein
VCCQDDVDADFQHFTFADESHLSVERDGEGSGGAGGGLEDDGVDDEGAYGGGAGAGAAP